MEPTILVIFGITGDLAKRYLLPSLYHLVEQNLLHEKTRIIGVTRGELQLDELLSTVELCVNKVDGVCDPATVHKLRSRLQMRHMDVTKPDEYDALLLDLNKIEDENGVHMNSSRELVDIFRATPLNGGSRKDSGRVLHCHKDHDGHKDVYGRIDARQPAPTMTTACINPSKGRFVHPRQHHGITVRQAARIQTFPDDFVFEGGLMAAGVQIGNAVPVRLGEVLIRALRPIVRKARQQRETGAA